ncbi:patatin-like phospholipase family protein [Sphingobium aromaticiconvertens]|uniref:patatin-like phospholipase family protein n=1 Tax=Sphingobium aromaticiconvertens TaxID=365341 RepID=UPI00301A5E22
MDKEKPLRVLTIDGGGMRGIYSAAFLHELSSLFAKKRGCKALDVGKGFDLIVGTSTGAIVGCALAAGEPLSKVVKLYRENGPKIFPERVPSSTMKVLGQMPRRGDINRRGAAALKTALTAVLGTKTFKEIETLRGIALSIPAVEMSQQRAWVFKTSHWGGTRDDDTKLVDACMATSAAPIFRSLAAVDVGGDLGGYRVFADGGLWANNPVLVGLLDAIKMNSTRPIEIFALGSYPKPDGERIAKADLDRGYGDWQFGAKAASLSIAAQEFAFDNMARMFAKEFTNLGRPISVIRFPKGDLRPDIVPYLELDNSSDKAMTALIDQARADVNLAKSACDDTADATGQIINSLFENMPCWGDDANNV